MKLSAAVADGSTSQARGQHPRELEHQPDQTAYLAATSLLTRRSALEEYLASGLSVS